MSTRRPTRRDILKGSAALGAAAFSTRVSAQAPAAEAPTPALIEAAKKEGKVVWYTSVDLPLAEKVGKAFETKYPGIAVRVERSGAERVFQRIGQEAASNIRACDVVNSSDAAHMIVWKRDGWLAPYVPEDVAKFYPAEHKDADGTFASFRVTLSVIAYNTVTREARGRAQKLRRPARSEMGRQDHQGASGLFGHDPDRDAPDVARSRLGVFREARQAAHHAGAVGGRSAEEARARRARRDGGRRRICGVADEGVRQADRAGLCQRRLAADHRAERDLQECARTRMPRGCSRATRSRPNVSSSLSIPAGCARCIRRPRRRPAACRSRTSRR